MTEEEEAVESGAVDFILRERWAVALESADRAAVEGVLRLVSVAEDALALDSAGRAVVAEDALAFPSAAWACVGVAADAGGLPEF